MACGQFILDDLSYLNLRHPRKRVPIITEIIKSLAKRVQYMNFVSFIRGVNKIKTILLKLVNLDRYIVMNIRIFTYMIL